MVIFVKIDGSSVDVGHLAGAGAAYKTPASSHGNLGSASDDMEAFDTVCGWTGWGPIPGEGRFLQLERELDS